MDGTYDRSETRGGVTTVIDDAVLSYVLEQEGNYLNGRLLQIASGTNRYDQLGRIFRTRAIQLRIRWVWSISCLSEFRLCWAAGRRSPPAEVSSRSCPQQPTVFLLTTPTSLGHSPTPYSQVWSLRDSSIS